MIGKISGKDWSKAPKDATHICVFPSTYHMFYKYDNRWRCCDRGSNKWTLSATFYNNGENNLNWSKGRLISKEEDLGIKQVKSINDLEVGMFFKIKMGGNEFTYLVTGNTVLGKLSALNFVTLDPRTWWTQEGFVDHIAEWSYTYAGPYTPVIKETEQDRQIKAIEEEITQAQKALDNAITKLDSFKSQA